MLSGYLWESTTSYRLREKHSIELKQRQQHPQIVNMACIVAGNSPSVFGSGSSPFIGGKCPSPLLQRKRPQRLDVPLHSPELNAPCSAMEQPMEVNAEGFQYAVSNLSEDHKIKLQG
jgi:hypothetical protein